MTRRSLSAAVAALLVAGAARADAPWLVARGRVAPQQRLEAFGGVRSVGVGAVLPDGEGGTPGAAFAAEALYGYLDRAVELRGARVWQLTPSAFATASAFAAMSVLLAPQGPALGAGPHGGLTLALGGRTFSVQLGLQAGLEVFGNPPTPLRFPLRALLGLDFALGPVSVTVLARAGMDLEPGQPYAGRGDAVVALGWLRE